MNSYFSRIKQVDKGFTRIVKQTILPPRISAGGLKLVVLFHKNRSVLDKNRKIKHFRQQIKQAHTHTGIV